MHLTFLVCIAAKRSPVLLFLFFSLSFLPASAPLVLHLHFEKIRSNEMHLKWQSWSFDRDPWDSPAHGQGGLCMGQEGKGMRQWGRRLWEGSWIPCQLHAFPWPAAKHYCSSAPLWAPPCSAVLCASSVGRARAAGKDSRGIKSLKATGWALSSPFLLGWCRGGAGLCCTTAFAIAGLVLPTPLYTVWWMQGVPALLAACVVYA